MRTGQQILPGTCRGDVDSCLPPQTVTLEHKLLTMAQRGILSFFNKASKPLSTKEGKSDGERSQNGTEEVKSTSRVREEENVEDSCRHRPVTDSSESPVMKRKSKRRRVIVDSDDDVGEGEVEKEVGGSKQNGREEEEEGGEEEREESKTETGVCGNGSERKGNDVEMEVGKVKGKEEEMEVGKVKEEEEMEVGKVKGKEEEEERIEAKVEEKGMNTGKGKSSTMIHSLTTPTKAPTPVTVTVTAVARTPPKRQTARKHTGKVRHASSSSRSSLLSKSELSPPKKQKLDNERSSSTSSDIEVKEKAESGVAEPEAKMETVGEEGDGSLEPMEVEKGEVMDTSKEKGGEQEEEKERKEESDSLAAEKEGTTESEKKKKHVHPFFAPKTPQGASKKAMKKGGSADSPSNKAQRSCVPPSSPSTTAVTTTPGTSSTGSSGNVKRVEAAEYNPAQKEYHPAEDACWQQGEKVPYLAIAKTFERIEEESKRLKIVSTLTNFFRSVILLSPNELVQCVYLCLNKLSPAYEGLELGIGESLLVKAIASATGRSVQQIKAEAVEKGDLGSVAESSRNTQRMMFTPPKLMVSAVFAKLKEIATMTGSASTSKKVDIIKGLFVACRHSEARYLIRSLGGKLRIGLAEQSVLTAIAHAAVYTPPGQDEVVDASKTASAEKFHKNLEDAALKLKTSYCEHPNYEALIPALLTHGLDQLSVHCRLTPGIPLKPMLAHPTKGVQEVLRRFEDAKFTCEWKYDGERAQIHVLEGGEIRVYSRNSENNTSKYPDIIARMPKVLKDSVTSCVIDSEAVAWDTEKQQILPFQVLSTRKKKGASVSDIQVQVCVFAFDLIFLNGKSLVREPFQTRRELLLSSFNEIKGEFMFAQSMDSSSVDEIQEFMEESIKGNCEGLMVKTLEKDATYEIARRSHNWLKLKKDYLEGVGDTLDLVVVGGFHGTGRRTGKYGGFLLACYDEDEEEFQVICKIGTGFSDEQLEKHTEFFGNHVIETPKAYYRCSDGVQPDQWFDSIQVWEVKAADLSISPVYTAAAGIVDPEKGISLRFPRFLRIRDDKKPEEATTSRQVAEMYKNQKNSVQVSGSAHDPEDFY